MADLYGTDVTIGVDTAVNITLEAIDRLRTTGSSLLRAFLVETMGRDCGYIALMAGIAGGAEVIAIPEHEVEPHEVAERLQAAYRRGKTHALVVVAEGARHGTDAIVNHIEAHHDSIGFELRNRGVDALGSQAVLLSRFAEGVSAQPIRCAIQQQRLARYCGR